MQRVAALKGSFPIIVVAPHGFDDPHTATIVEQIHKELDCWAVINYGWERADQYNYFKDKANCNSIAHCHEDVVKQEFLDPLLEYVMKVQDAHGVANIFYIHGCSNEVRKIANDDIDIIVGYGEGNPPSFTCDIDSRDALFHVLNKQSFKAYAGKPGGNYSARRIDNLTQLYRSWYPDDLVMSFQLEVVKALREDEIEARITGDGLANALEDYLEAVDSDTNYDPIIYRV